MLALPGLSVRAWRCRLAARGTPPARCESMSPTDSGGTGPARARGHRGPRPGPCLLDPRRAVVSANPCTACRHAGHRHHHASAVRSGLGRWWAPGHNPCMRVEMRTKPRGCPKRGLRWMGRPPALTEEEVKGDFLPPCSGWWPPGAPCRSSGAGGAALHGSLQPPRRSSCRDSSSPATGDEGMPVVSSLLGAPWGHLLVRPSSGLGH